MSAINDGPHSANATPTTKGVLGKHLLTLPRELRDNIYEILIDEEERKPYQLKTAKHPMGDARIKASSNIILACRQIHEEYSGMVAKAAAAPPSDMLIKYRREPINSLRAEIWDMKFGVLSGFLKSISQDDLEGFRTGNKLYISLYFSPGSDATRKDLLEWVRFCHEYGISANYQAPDLLDGVRARYVYIYDFFDEKSDGQEEEKIFRGLQAWYAFRDVPLDGRCGTWRNKKCRAEVMRAQKENLRKPRSPEECGHAVRSGDFEGGDDDSEDE